MKLLRFLFFNYFTDLMVSHSEAFIPGRRLRAMMSDLNHMMAAFTPVFLIIWVPAMILSDIFIEDLVLSMRILTSFGLIPFSIMFFMIINKDFYQARSLAKRKYGYQIIDSKTGKIATQMQCVIRNLTAFVWPIEVPFILFTPNRRLGDRIASTKLIDVEKTNPKTIFDDIDNFKKTAEIKKVIWVSVLITTLMMSTGLLLTLI